MVAQMQGAGLRPRNTVPSPQASTIVADGVWTWFNRPQARYRNGATYIGHNTQSGTPKISKYVHATRSVTQFSLAGALQVDDHMVPCLEVWPDGKLFALYSKLGDTVVRHRTSTNADDISAWGAEQTITPPDGYVTTYTSPYYLSGPGRMFGLIRTHQDGRVNRYTHSADGSSWSSCIAFFRGTTGQYPYLVSAKKGTDEIHICGTDTHPVFGQSSIFHFYGKWSEGAGALKWYKTDGTEITASLPFLPANATLVFSGASERAWNWDIAIGADGNPRVLFTKYPNNNGTDVRMMFSRWSGSAWTTPVDIKGASVGTGLYDPEIYYTGGAAFDDADPDIVYLCSHWRVSGRYDVQKYVTQDDGATWALRNDFSAAASGHHCLRPVSPRDHNGELPVVWVQGDYNTYNDYTTAIMGLT